MPKRSATSPSRNAQAVPLESSADASSDSENELANGDDEELSPELRPAKIDDVPAILALLQSNLVFKLEPDFESKLKRALATAEWPKEGAGGRFACVIAALEDILIGVVVTYTFNLGEAVADGRMSYELLQSRKKDTEAVMVKVLAVDRPHRRGGLGTELLYAGVRSLAIQSPTAGAALFYAPAGHVPSADFIESIRFTPMGYLRNYYQEKPLSSAPAAKGKGEEQPEEERFDAVVWAAAFHDFELEEYTNNNNRRASEEDDEEDYGGLVDLGDPNLPSKRVKHMPKWAKSCLLQYALPLGLVFFLFLVTYVFVLYGPVGKLGLDKLISPPSGMHKSAEREALERAAAAHEEAPSLSFPHHYEIDDDL